MSVVKLTPREYSDKKYQLILHSKISSEHADNVLKECGYEIGEPEMTFAEAVKFMTWPLTTRAQQEYDRSGLTGDGDSERDRDQIDYSMAQEEERFNRQTAIEKEHEWLINVKNSMTGEDWQKWVACFNTVKPRDLQQEESVESFNNRIGAHLDKIMNSRGLNSVPQERAPRPSVDCMSFPDKVLEAVEGKKEAAGPSDSASKINWVDSGNSSEAAFISGNDQLRPAQRPLSVEQLIRTRLRVELVNEKCAFKKGDILTIPDVSVYEVQANEVVRQEVGKYAHSLGIVSFTIMNWWESREAHELPEFLKRKGKVYAVKKREGGTVFVMKEEEMVARDIRIYGPATEEEYNAYVAQQKEKAPGAVLSGAFLYQTKGPTIFKPFDDARRFAIFLDKIRNESNEIYQDLSIWTKSDAYVHVFQLWVDRYMGEFDDATSERPAQ